jgi:DNA-directed RNA polymerase subunit RPC12/RpoP
MEYKINSIEELEFLQNIYKSQREKGKNTIKYICKNCGKEEVHSLRNKHDLICGPCKRKIGILATYKKNKNNIRQQIENTNLQKYGVKHPNQSQQQIQKIKQTKKNRYGDENYNNSQKMLQTAKQNDSYKKASQKRANTNLQKYGNKCSLHTEEMHEKLKKIFLEKYGTEWVFGRKRLYRFDGQDFDSSWELAFYVWLKDNNLKFEYQPRSNFFYIDSNGKKRKYQPDFLIENEYYEIKGPQFFNEKGEPFDVIIKKYWKEKHQLMLENNIHILQKNDIAFYIDYVKKTYGIEFFKICRKK